MTMSEKTKNIREQADRYIQSIKIMISQLKQYKADDDLSIVMTKDVFDVLMAGTIGTTTIDVEYRTICGLKCEIISGTQKIYVGKNLCPKENRQ